MTENKRILQGLILDQIKRENYTEKQKALYNAVDSHIDIYTSLIAIDRKGFPTILRR